MLRGCSWRLPICLRQIRGWECFSIHGGGSSATLLAGRPFHFEYESLFMKLLVLVDLPAMLGMLPLSLVWIMFSIRLHLGFYQGSYLTAGVLLFGASCEWLLVGYRIDQSLVCKRWGIWPRRQQIYRWFRFLVAAIVIITRIATPIVNGRSRRLGFRHAGVSSH